MDISYEIGGVVGYGETHFESIMRNESYGYSFLIHIHSAEEIKFKWFYSKMFLIRKHG
jgi:hypothetical protein